MRNYFLAAEAPELKPGLEWCRLSQRPAHLTPGKYLFGSEQADTSLLGLAGEDHIYSGSGDDTINGQAGAATPGTTLPIGQRTSAASNSKAEPTNGSQGKADCENTMNSGAACARNTSVLATFMGRKRACRHSKHALNAKSQSISNSKSANLIEQHHA